MFLLGLNIILQLSGALAAAALVISEQIDKAETCWEVMSDLYIRQYIYTLGNFFII